MRSLSAPAYRAQRLKVRSVGSTRLVMKFPIWNLPQLRQTTLAIAILNTLGDAVKNLNKKQTNKYTKNSSNYRIRKKFS